MEVKENIYIRVGTQYYKKAFKPLISGDKAEQLLKWTPETIRQDYGKEYLSKVEKFDGFCCVPSHLHYKRNIYNFYNTYEPLNIKPSKSGNIQTTLNFLKHMFGKQYELGLDYIKILFDKPVQMLPVLCFVSNERGTGKTTFINYLKLIFQKNMTFNTNEDFRSQFNSDWSTKLIIAIDEVLLDKKEDSERIKNLSTSKTYKENAKFINKGEIEFFGKFILCSNNETNFIKIDSLETRYWVIKVPVIKKTDINLLGKLKSEIPAFINYLLTREYYSKWEDRMWFNEKLIITDALKRIKANSRAKLEIEFVLFVNRIFEDFNIDEYKFCVNDVIQILKNYSIQAGQNTVRNLLKNKWKIEPISNSSTYKKYILNHENEIYEVSGKGRYYTVTKSFLLKNFDDLMTL